MTTYREATRKEIQKALGQLEAVHDWSEVFAFAMCVYGKNVVRARVYSKVGCPALRWIDGYDVKGNKLEPDFALPFWQRVNDEGKKLVDLVDVYHSEKLAALKQSRRPQSFTEDELERAYRESLQEVVKYFLPELYHRDFYNNEYFLDSMPSGEEEMIVLYTQEK